jgi:hypothetical protein
MRTSSTLRLQPEWFIRYKFVNALFLGLSVGAIFTIYAPLDPSIYSVGGIVLAVAMLIVARLYHRIMSIGWFFRISLFVELVLLGAIGWFLLIPYTYQTALLVYIGYQATFVFGNYLVRAETLLLPSDTQLTRLDTAKQLGYLGGMVASWLFYQLISRLGIEGNQEKVYALHYLLFATELLVIFLILKSFQRATQKK